VCGGSLRARRAPAGPWPARNRRTNARDLGVPLPDAGLVHALLLGVVAGLAVAMPLGPVGVLLLRTGLTSPRRVAFAAAAGIATVDLVYALLAVLIGSRVAVVVGAHDVVLRRVAGAVLLVVGVVEVVRSARRMRARRAEQPAADARAVPGAAPEPSALRTSLRFVALTAVNPLTALTFATVAAGLAARLATTGSAHTVALLAFPLGAGAASLAWQCALAGASGLIGTRLSPRVRAATEIAAAGLVVVLAGLVTAS